MEGIQTLNDLLRSGITAHARPDMFRYKSGGRWVSVSSEGFEEMVERTRRGLDSLGVGKGIRVALLSENRLEWAVTDLAVLRAGAIVVPIYPTLIPEQVAYILNDSGPGVVFCSTAEQVEKVLGVRDQVPSLEHIVSFDSLDRAGLLTLEEVQHRGETRKDAASDVGRSVLVEGDDVATIIYTSGTTGDPKGVMLTHDNIVQNVLSLMKVIEISPEDSYLSFLPLSHIFERMGGYYAMIYRGVQINYAESIDTLLENLLEVRPTAVFAVPRLFEKIYERTVATAEQGGALKRKVFFWAEEVALNCAQRDIRGESIGAVLKLKCKIADAMVFAKLRDRMGGRIRFFVSGGAPLSENLAGFLYSAGLPVLEGYGLTETSPVISVNTFEHIRFGSVGKPIPGVEARIAEDGEILTRSRCVMKGYYGRPEKTAEVLGEDGWFHTGDVGRFDEDGFLYISDRKKDIIVTANGKKVSPQPIENRLKRLNSVAEVALIGDKYKYVLALVVPDFDWLEDFAASEGIENGDLRDLLDKERVRAVYQAAIDEVNADLARHEQIKKFALLDRKFTVETGELTPTMKIKRRAIEENWSKVIDGLREEDAGE